MTSPIKILIINGPNMNMLGEREKDIYGDKNLADIEDYTNNALKSFGQFDCEWYQSNSESEIIKKIHSTYQKGYKAIIINPGAYTHTSVAIYDALNCVETTKIEVHLSHTNAREEFRQKKITTKACQSVIEGFGYKVYLLAILSTTI